MKQKRARLPTATQIAAAVLSVVREIDGKLVPIIPREIAVNLSAGEILAMVDWHHIVPHAIGGSDHPSNIEPILRPEHKARTAKIDVPQIAKTKRIAKAEQDFRVRLSAKTGRTGDAPTRKRSTWPSRPMKGMPNRKWDWKLQQYGEVQRETTTQIDGNRRADQGATDRDDTISGGVNAAGHAASDDGTSNGQRPRSRLRSRA